MHTSVTDEKASVEVNAIGQALLERIGPEKFKVWFGPGTRLTLRDDGLEVLVQSTFTSRWIERHYIDDILHAAEAVLGRRPAVSFDILPGQPATKAPGRTAAHTPSTPKPGPHPKPCPGHIQPKLKLTLDSFVVGPSNELAFNAAQAVVRHGQSPFNPLFIHGGYGVGKTHLLQGICNELGKVRPEAQWLYLSAEDFANQFISALKSNKIEAFRQRLRLVDLLAIDDIHFLANKTGTQEEFLHTFNTISMAGKQVVLVSDAAPRQIQQLSEKLVNRFVSGMVVRVEPPDFATRCRICRQYSAGVMKATFADRPASVDLPESVIQCIAETVPTNVRELEGAVVKIVAHAALLNLKVTMALAKTVLTEHISRTQRVIRMQDIESVVTSWFGTTTACLHSEKKDKAIALARHFCMYLARKHTKLSSPEIGRLMGGKNHATVLFASQKVQDMVERNAEVHWRGPQGNKVVKAKDLLGELESEMAR